MSKPELVSAALSSGEENMWTVTATIVGKFNFPISVTVSSSSVIAFGKPDLNEEVQDAVAQAHMLLQTYLGQ